MVDYPSNAPLGSAGASTFTTRTPTPDYAAGLVVTGAGGGNTAVPVPSAPSAVPSAPSAGTSAAAPAAALATPTAAAAPAAPTPAPSLAVTEDRATRAGVVDYTGNDLLFQDPLAAGKLNPDVAKRYADGGFRPATIRLNNMGGMSGKSVYPGQVAVTPRPKGEGSVYHVYATPELGVAAASHNLDRLIAAGFDTPATLAPKWAQVPGKAYAPTLAASLGIGVNDKIDISDLNTRAAILKAQSGVESGLGMPIYNDEVYTAGINQALAPDYLSAAPTRSAALARIPAATNPADYQGVIARGGVGGPRPPADIPAPGPTPPGAAAAPATLRMGARGPEVQQMQQQLREAGFNPGPIDSILGQRTRDALFRFQEAHPGTGTRLGLSDAVYGPRSRAALTAATAGGGARPSTVPDPFNVDHVVGVPAGHTVDPATNTLVPGRFTDEPGPTGGGVTPSELAATDAMGQARAEGPGVVGGPGAPGVEATPADAAGPPRPGSTVIVKPGDTLWDIAAMVTGNRNIASKYATEIMRANGIRDPRALQPGQRIVLPGGMEAGNIPTPRQRPGAPELPPASDGGYRFANPPERTGGPGQPGWNLNPAPPPSPAVLAPTARVDTGPSVNAIGFPGQLVGPGETSGSASRSVAAGAHDIFERQATDYARGLLDEGIGISGEPPFSATNSRGIGARNASDMLWGDTEAAYLASGATGIEGEPDYHPQLPPPASDLARQPAAMPRPLVSSGGGFAREREWDPIVASMAARNRRLQLEALLRGNPDYAEGLRAY